MFASTPGAASSVTLPAMFTVSAKTPLVTTIADPLLLRRVAAFPVEIAPFSVPKTRSLSLSSAVPIIPSPS